MYQCTKLADKYLKATIVTANSTENKSTSHPCYKFKNGQKPDDSKLIRVNPDMPT